MKTRLDNPGIIPHSLSSKLIHLYPRHHHHHHHHDDDDDDDDDRSSDHNLARYFVFVFSFCCSFVYFSFSLLLESALPNDIRQGRHPSDGDWRLLATRGKARRT